MSLPAPARSALLRLRRRGRFLLPAVRLGRRLAATGAAGRLLRATDRPPGCHLRMEDWHGSPDARAAGDRFVVVHPAGVVERALPLTYGEPVPWLFRHLARHPRPAEGVHVLHGARYWGHYAGALYSCDGYLLAELSQEVWEPPVHTAQLVRRLPPCRHLRGTTAVLTTREAWNNFYHWTCELLPRLGLLADAGFPPEAVDRYLIPRGAPPFAAATLDELGLPRAKRLEVDAADHLACDLLLAPSVRRAHWDTPRWAIRYLRERLPAEGPPVARRLFLTRRDAAFRRLRNEDELTPVLERHGFTPFVPTSVTLPRQRAAFAHARRILGVHGSALVNVVHCGPGTRIAEIFPPVYTDACFWNIADALGLPYACLVADGERPPDGTDPRARFGDLHLDPGRLDAFLAAWLADRPPAHA